MSQASGSPARACATGSCSRSATTSIYNQWNAEHEKRFNWTCDFGGTKSQCRFRRPANGAEREVAGAGLELLLIPLLLPPRFHHCPEPCVPIYARSHAPSDQNPAWLLRWLGEAIPGPG